MPRPRRYRSFRITSFYIPSEYEDLMRKVRELCAIEGKVKNDLILEALVEYVQKHYPGNPQVTLPSIVGETPQPVRLQARFTGKELEEILREIRRARNSPLYTADLRRKAKKLVVTLSRLNLRLRSEEVSRLIERALKMLEGTS